jgi:hypothetical protein
VRREGERIESGLWARWESPCFVNPPYGRVIGRWIVKAMTEPVDELILLVPARTDTAWFQPLFAHTVCFVRGRLRFSGAASGAPFPPALVYRGWRVPEFVTAFKHWGPVVALVEHIIPCRTGPLEYGASPSRKPATGTQSQWYGATAYTITRPACTVVSERDGGVHMLQRTASYSSLLRVLGGCFLLYGLYVIVFALTAQIEVSGSVQYSGPVIFENVMAVENFIFYGGFFAATPILPVPYRSLDPFGMLTPGPVLWVGLAILCVSLTTKLTIKRVQLSYAGLQTALWMISASVWTPILWLLGSTQYGLGAVGPLFLVTLALSLLLLALYKPVAHSLSQLVLPPTLSDRPATGA